MSNLELNQINNSIRNSLIEQGFLKDSNIEYLQTSPTVILPFSNSFQKTFQFKNINTSSFHNQKVDYFRKELATLRRDFTLNIQQIRQEMNENNQRNNPYVYNDELSKFRQEHTKKDNDILIQMQQLWLNMKEIQTEMETLKLKYSSTTYNENSVEDKLSHLSQKVDIINKKENEMCKTVNELNKNNKIFENNIKKLKIKINEHSNDIKEIKKMHPSLQKGVNNGNNNQFNEFIQQNEFMIYKSNVKNKFELMNDNYNTRITLFTKEINDLKEIISALTSKNQINNDIQIKDNFTQFQTNLKQLNEQYNKKIILLEDKLSVVDKKIELMDECNEKNFGNVNNTHESNLSQINENKQNIQILQKNIQIMKENNENILKDVNNYKEELKNWQNQVMSLIVQNEKRLIRSEFNSLNESNKRENQDLLNNEDPLDVYQ